jgi:hypothetical protein
MYESTMFHWRPPSNQTASVGLAQRLDDRLGVGHLRVGRVEHLHVLQPAREPRADHPLLLAHAHRAVGVSVAAGRRDDHGLRVRASRQFDERLDVPVPSVDPPPTMTSVPFGGPYSGGPSASTAPRGAVANISRRPAARRRSRLPHACPFHGAL